MVLPFPLIIIPFVLATAAPAVPVASVPIKQPLTVLVVPLILMAVLNWLLMANPCIVELLVIKLKPVKEPAALFI